MYISLISLYNYIYIYIYIYKMLPQIDAMAMIVT